MIPWSKAPKAVRGYQLTARSIAHNTSDSSFADTCPGALAFPMLPKLITLPNKPPQSLLTHPVRPIDIVIKSVSG